MTTGPQGIDESVIRARTGKTSDEWYAVLDRWGAKAKGHSIAARYLHDDCGLTHWWAQCILVRYELSRGKR